MATENYLLTIQGNVAGQFNECVQCFQSAGLNSVDTLDAAGDLLNSWIAHAQSKWLAVLPPSYTLDLIMARRAFPKPSNVAKVQYQSFSVQGTRGGDASYWNLCPSVFLVPGMGIKSGGKTFLPAVPQGDIVNNQYQAAYITVVQTLFTQLITGLAGSGTNWQLAIFSRKLRVANLVMATTLSSRLGMIKQRRAPLSGGTRSRKKKKKP
jgi:hypothetical protein